MDNSCDLTALVSDPGSATCDLGNGYPKCAPLEQPTNHALPVRVQLRKGRKGPDGLRSHAFPSKKHSNASAVPKKHPDASVVPEGLCAAPGGQGTRAAAPRSRPPPRTCTWPSASRSAASRRRTCTRAGGGRATEQGPGRQGVLRPIGENSLRGACTASDLLTPVSRS